MDTELLKTLCGLHGPSGDEVEIQAFILKYIESNAPNWRTMPEIFHGQGFQECIILKFGQPRTAIFAHMDTVGFTVRYENQLVAIGGPDTQGRHILRGKDGLGPIKCRLSTDENNHLFHDFSRPIDRGTTLTFKCDFRESKNSITSCYLDNRLGVYSALKVAEELTDGIIVFSTWEEHGGGSIPFLIRFIYERWTVRQALISDITWVTDGIYPGNGVVISLRDRNIPRKAFTDHVIKLAEASGVDYQLEVEGSGSSDGREIQQSPYPIDWCFIGAAEENTHTPNETVIKSDIEDMINLYKYLMQHL